MKTLIYGAGPLGSLMAARLHEAGHDVALLARGQRLLDLRRHGVVLEEEGSEHREVVHVPVVEALDPDDDYDLVMVVMRKNQAEEILPTLAANDRVGTFLFMMNNAEGPGPLVDALGADRVMLGFPLPGGSREGHVVRIVPVNERATSTLPIGEVDGRTRARTREVAALLESMRGYEVDVRDDMPAWLKYHAAVTILGLSPAIYAAGIDMERLGRTRDLLVLTIRSIKEAFRGLRKDVGIPPAPRSFRLLELTPEPVLVALFAAPMRKGQARSSIEGHTAAARDEVVHVGGELLAELREAGAEIPSIERMLAHWDADEPLYPDGMRGIPLRWGGLVGPAAALVALGAAAALARR